MVRVFSRRTGEQIYSLGARENPRDDIAGLRKEVRQLRQDVARLPLVDFEEAIGIAAAQAKARPQFQCARCHAAIEDPSVKKCPSCGGRAAVVVSGDEAYVCAECSRPVDPALEACPSCGSKRAIEVTGKLLTDADDSEFVCAECHAPVGSEQPQCHRCGNAKAVRRKDLPGAVAD